MLRQHCVEKEPLRVRAVRYCYCVYHSRLPVVLNTADSAPVLHSQRGVVQGFTVKGEKWLRPCCVTHCEGRRRVCSTPGTILCSVFSFSTSALISARTVSAMAFPSVRHEKKRAESSSEHPVRHLSALSGGADSARGGFGWLDGAGGTNEFVTASCRGMEAGSAGSKQRWLGKTRDSPSHGCYCGLWRTCC